MRTEGIKGLYRGIVPCFWRDCPFLGIYFWSNEYFQEKLFHLSYKETSKP